MLRPVSHAVGTAMVHLMVFDDDPVRSAELAGTLTTLGFGVTEAGPTSGAGAVLKRERAGALVVSDVVFAAEPAGSGLSAAAAAAGIPVLVVVGDDADPLAMAEKFAKADDWVSRRALDSELPARVARLVKGRAGINHNPNNKAGADPRAGSSGMEKSGSTLPSDAEFFALVVHDLRTPLNVIGLSLRMISQALPQGDPELDEDMRFVDENFRQIERMLSQLSDFYRLFENEAPLMPMPFSPRRMIDELIEARASKLNGKLGPVLLNVQPDCPQEVDLDPTRARQAIQYALLNASTASGGDPIRLTMHGGPDRWVIEVAIDKPAPPSVHSVALSPKTFERLCGFAAERRGMDLAIAAKVTEMFGGSARLDVDEGRGTNVVLDWPTRIAPA